MSIAELSLPNPMCCARWAVNINGTWNPTPYKKLTPHIARNVMSSKCAHDAELLAKSQIHVLQPIPQFLISSALTGKKQT